MSAGYSNALGWADLKPGGNNRNIPTYRSILFFPTSVPHQGPIASQRLILLALSVQESPRPADRKVNSMDGMDIRQPTSRHLLRRDETLSFLLQKRDDELEILSFGAYRLIPYRRLLLAGQDQIELGSRAFDILVLLVRRHGEVVSSRQIFEYVWPGQKNLEESNIRVQISALRQTLKKGGQQLIKTVHGRGYVFIETLRVSRLEA
jgi:DNA-binding winged helix-turn-helix (wHTH) protein